MLSEKLETPDFPIAIFIHENWLSFDVADSQSLAALVASDQCIEYHWQSTTSRVQI